MSILVSTLNYNLPDLTDNLVSQINQSSFKDYELMVVDNGSTINRAQSTTHTVDENLYYGGGVNLILDYFLSTKHDYLLILNNDLIFHGYNILQELINAATRYDLSAISPSIINAEINQCHWKQMHCWGTNSIRNVKWVDFQAPMLRRDICEIIKQYPIELFLGWGLDFYTGLVAEENNLKIGVHDGITFTHLNSQTFKQGNLNISLDDFCRSAEYNMHDYFIKNNLLEKYIEYRRYAENYCNMPR